ncbi:MAG: hypothetical protein ACYDEO_17335 [Aggregatilineales bacterium]
MAVGVSTGALSSSIMDTNFEFNDLLKLISSDLGIGVMAGMGIKVLLLLHLSMKRLGGMYSIDLVSRRNFILNINGYIIGFLICAGVLGYISTILGDTASSLGLFAVCLAEVFVALIFNMLNFLVSGEPGQGAG